MSSSRRRPSPPPRARTAPAPAPRPERPLAWWVPRVGWTAVLVAVAASVLVFLRGGTDLYSLPKLTVVQVAVLVGAACRVIDRRWRRRPTPVPSVALAVGGYGAAMVLATVFSFAPTLSVFGAFSRHAGLVSLVTYLGLAWLVVAYTWERPERLVTLAVVWVAAGSLHGAYAVAQHLGVEPFLGDVAHDTSAIGTVGNTNFSGAVLAVVLVLLPVAWVRAGSTWWRYAVVGGAVVSAGGLWFSQSRGAFVAVVAGVAVAACLLAAHTPRWVRALLVTVAVGAVGLVVVMAVQSSGVSSAEKGLLSTSTLAGRVQYWETAVTVIRQHPVLGTGPDTFGLVFPPASPPDLQGRPFPVDKPHNILLERGVDAGVIGLVSYLAIVGLTLAAAYRARAAEDAPTPLVACFAGAFVAYLVQGMFSIDAVPLAITGWLLVGALASLADPWVRRARAATPLADDWPLPDRPAPVVTLVAATTLTVALVVVTFVPAVADRRFRAAFDQANAAKRGKATAIAVEQAYDDAIALYPFEPTMRQQAAENALGLLDGEVSKADLRQIADYARRNAEAGLAQAPGSVALWMLRAQALRYQARAGDAASWEAADGTYRDIEAWDPYNATPWTAHANLLLDWAEVPGTDPSLVDERRRSAAAYVERGAQVADPNFYWYTWYQLALVYERLGNKPEALAAAQRANALDPTQPSPPRLVERLQRG